MPAHRETVDRIRTSAHRHALQISPKDLIGSLCEKLGATLVAFLVDRDVSTISRWKKKDSIDEEVLRPLRVAYQIFKMLEEHDADPTIRAWFLGANPQLDDQSPAEAIRVGQNRETLAAARAFISGG